MHPGYGVVLLDTVGGSERVPQSGTGGKQLGILLASGLIVGESLLGVAFAAMVTFSRNEMPIAFVGSNFNTASIWLGSIVFALTIFLLYRWITRLARAWTSYYNRYS